MDGNAIEGEKSWARAINKILRPLTLASWSQNSNIWITEGLLNSMQAVSLVDFLRRSGGKILLPEIVERELAEVS